MSKRGMVEIEAALNDPANQTGSGAWARAASDDELEYHVDGGFPGNQAYEAAIREIARREAARSESLQLRWIKRTFWVTIVLGLAGIAASLFS